MKESTIFTRAELEALDRRSRGDKSDPTGIFAVRVKPRLLELLGWFEDRRKLRQLVR